MSPDQLPLELAEALDIDVNLLEKSQIDYHINLLISQKMLHRGEMSEGFPMFRQISGLGLTWEGHEFLDAARDSKNWEQAKQVGNKVGGLTLDVMKAVLIGLAKEQLRGLGLPVA